MFIIRRGRIAKLNGGKRSAGTIVRGIILDLQGELVRCQIIVIDFRAAFKLENEILGNLFVQVFQDGVVIAACDRTGRDPRLVDAVCDLKKLIR